MAYQVPLTREALEKCVREYKHEKASYFKLPGDLKSKQIPNAIKKFAPGVKAEDVVALMDTTLFDNGKDGYLITLTHMYGKSFEGKTIDLNRVSKLHRDDSYLTVTYPDGTSDKLYVIIFDRDLFNFLSMVMDASSELQKSEPIFDKAAPAFDKIMEQLVDPEAAPDPEPESAPVPPDPAPELPVDANVNPDVEEEVIDDIIPTPAEIPADVPADVPADIPDDTPSVPAPDSAVRAEELFKKGTAAFMVKDYAAAREAFRQAAELGHQKAAQFLKQLELMGK